MDNKIRRLQMYTYVKGHTKMKISKFTYNLARIIMDFLLQTCRDSNMITKCEWDNQLVIILPFIQLRNKRMQKLMKFPAVAAAKPQ